MDDEDVNEVDKEFASEEPNGELPEQTPIENYKEHLQVVKE